MAEPEELALKPGTERWAVKTGTDKAASTIPPAIVPTTIANLIILPAPADPDLLADRLAPVELIRYQLSATLTGYKLEQDGDYHLVLDDGNGHTMIAEIPDPDFCWGSQWLSEITAARHAFDIRFGKMVAMFKAMAALAPGEGVMMITKVSVPVVVQGIGFFDKLHGQTGVAPNGIELHPVLDITFGS